jgi:uncharacterized protein YoxC
VIGDISTLLAALIAAMTSFALGILTHKRSSQVHEDELEVDHTKLIQDAYQGILLELRSELDRRKVSQDDLREKVKHLEAQLDQETKVRQELGRRFEQVSKELEEMKRRFTEEIGNGH